MAKLLKLVELVPENHLFSVSGGFLRTDRWCFHGLPLSPIIANLFMEDLEQRAIIQSAPLQPKLWVRYVDDTFVIWTHGKEELRAFHELLNRQCPSIQFPIEEEKEEQIAFLNVHVTHQGDRMSTAVYQKPPPTDRCLPFSSHHKGNEVHEGQGPPTV